MGTVNSQCFIRTWLMIVVIFACFQFEIYVFLMFEETKSFQDFVHKRIAFVFSKLWTWP